ncbi:ABC transporter ATP-binding protein [Halobacillus kuroshimensis]|uniref:ABC transporter ATP-binding protein n=1 Tax=Halobacillus kuroshimensis TaxID=302481 RepID=UPI000406EC69|nr:ABC transporter ATP-binding protein [Halobacillus kuroshimensis]
MAVVIKVDRLTKSFGKVQAVKGVSFSVKKGEIFGIIGPNGAGKTTTLEMIEGILKPDSGTIDVLGLTPNKELQQLNQRIGVQFQATSIQKKMKVKEALDLFAAFYPGKVMKQQLVEMLGLEEKMNVRFEDLSGGWKQRVTLALATLHQPEIIFLDEPSMGLDPHARREMWTLIRRLREKGSTIVLTTHYMEEAEQLCDRVAMIYSGELKAMDRPSALLEQSGAMLITFQSDDFPYVKLPTMPGVVKVEKEEDTFKVYSDDLQLTSYHLFTYGHQENLSLNHFQFTKGTLEDLFVQYLEKEEAK